ncbi:glucose-6-phosphate 1-epimerase [Orbus hercynius]|uniref:Putative glucose-6-phosphate 1-epimerase n=1 Tax=Orbus hercynius TaxID=593135 RepID=A0A495RHM7_9GAMM|nr:D-hexose-6-phosphate mutarotase [Orbus hercynius]RKS86929.1 glucose-6-phosphate 1-epimerase [Orbus hercynius]
MTIIEKMQATTSNQVILTHSLKRVNYEEHTLLLITHPKCHAAISLQGGHLLYWQPTGENTPIIWLSENAQFKKHVAIRGGMPICWPWFGQAGNPAHGFARIVDWTLQSHQETENGIDIVLCLTANEQTQPYWQNDFELSLHLHLGETCSAELTSLGNFDATSALHTYFGIDDISHTTVSGLGENYIEKLSTENIPSIAGKMRFNQEVDRIYTQADAITLINDNHRTIEITHHNYSDVVVWNPWTEKSKTIKDLQENSYRHFVCAETCRINQPIHSTSQQKTPYGVKIAVIK